MHAIIWFVAALIMAGLEALGGEFSLLLLGGAALATAGISLTGVPLWAEVVTFAVTAAILLIFVRPILHRHLHKEPVLDTTTRALVGKHAEVIETVTGTSGMVRLDGDIWSARSLEPTQSFSENDRVYVAEIDGSTAVVWKEYL